ncbi:MAG: ABC transporter permease [Burkholderiales bacterium]|nr:ABC transporter permease [Burkholderiales bacterium]
MLRLALRNLFRHRLRTGLTLTAIASGVAALILSGGFVEDMFHQLAEATIHGQLGHLQIYRAGFYENGVRDPYNYMIDQPESLKRRAKSVPQYEDAMERLNFSGLMNNGRADYSIRGEGLEASKEAKFGSYLKIISGRQLTDKDHFSILVGEGVAKALGLKPGDQATLLLNTQQGALNSLEFEVAGIFRSFAKDYDDRTVRIPLAAAKELLDTKGINALVVLLQSRDATDQARAALRDQLPAVPYDIKTWYELADFYRKTTELYRRQFGVLQLIILIMVLLSVVNSVSMSTFERIGEFGTLMALGDRGAKVFRLVIVENFFLGLIGALIGAMAGILLGLAISAVGIPMPPPPNMSAGYTATIRLVPWVVVGAILVGFAATVLAALLPARRVSRIPVVDALRENV